MTIPTATATGGAGSSAPGDYVKPRRIAILAGVIAALVTYATFASIELPWRVVYWCGGAPWGNARWGGIELRWQAPPKVDLGQLQERFRHHDLGAIFHDSEGDGTVVVEIPGVPESQAREVIALVEAGMLEFHEVVEGVDVKWLVDHELAFDERRDPGREPVLDVDQWRPEDGGPMHTDLYLRAHEREVLESAFDKAKRAGWAQPTGTRIAYERVTPLPGAKDCRELWRTYVIRDEVPLDGTAIAKAEGSYEPNTNRPIVLVDFDREGGRAFGELTERIVGHKLAIVVGGEVRSAPIINSAIHGGRASINMGYSDPERETHERDVLVATLRTGGLPIGGRVVSWKWLASTNGTAELVAHIALTVVAGLGSALVAMLLISFARPQRRRIDPVPGTGKRWRRVLWTLFGVALFALGTQMVIPWVNDVELMHVASKGKGVAAHGFAWNSIFGLGINPLISAFIVVEIVASLVPRLRRYRDGGPLRRRWLGLAVALLAAVLATVQAYFITSYLGQMSNYGVEMIDPGGRWLVIATFVAGTMLLAVIASMIGSRGIGNGYAILMVAGWLLGLFDYWWWDGELIPSHLAFAGLVVVAIAGVTFAMVRWHVRAPRSAALPLPSSGLGPLNPGAGSALIVAQLVALGVTAPAVVLDLVQSMQRGDVRGLVVVVVAAAVWSLLFAWPGRRRAELARADREPVTREVWLRGVALTAGMLLAIFLVAHAARTVAPELYFIVDPLVLMLVVASIADLGSEWRARRRDLVPVWALHDPLLVETVREQLGDIPHHIQATRLRGLLWLFGAFAPMMVLVPREDAERAATKLREWLEPS